MKNRLGCLLVAFIVLAASALPLTLMVIGWRPRRTPAAAAPPGTCGAGTLDVPARARPWIQKAAQVSGLPEGFLAAVAKQESDFDPGNFTPDINGGTWGLWQLNREEVGKFAPGVDPSTKDPMVQADVTGRYLKARLETVRQLQAAHKGKPFAALPDLDALVIAHNAGEGNLMKYPTLPGITRGYLDHMHQWFQAGPCENTATGAGAPNGVKPATGKVVSPIPDGVTGMQMCARYRNYFSGGAHWGVDLCKGGDGAWTFQSICDGTVVKVDIKAATANVNSYRNSGSTNYVWIDCGNRVWIGYAHWYAKDLNPAIKPGAKIGAGTPIAPQGNQGNSSGPHLHLQISTIASDAYSSSATVDPSAYLAGLGIQLPKANY